MIFKLGNSIKKLTTIRQNLTCYMGFSHTGYCCKLRTASFFEISQ